MSTKRQIAVAVLLAALAAATPLTSVRARADDAGTNPLLGQPEAIAAGRATYAAKCYVCHHSTGARGPNLFATKLSDNGFLQTVTNGRQGTQMPAFRGRLSADEIWQVHAFVKSIDHY
jgi:mono/diheme cytochrome c family protein